MVRLCLLASLIGASFLATPVTIAVDTPMAAPKWARLERQLLAANLPACREFYEKSSTSSSQSNGTGEPSG